MVGIGIPWLVQHTMVNTNMSLIPAYHGWYQHTMVDTNMSLIPEYHGLFVHRGVIRRKVNKLVAA